MPEGVSTIRPHNSRGDTYLLAELLFPWGTVGMVSVVQVVVPFSAVRLVSVRSLEARLIARKSYFCLKRTLTAGSSLSSRWMQQIQPAEISHAAAVSMPSVDTVSSDLANVEATVAASIYQTCWTKLNTNHLALLVSWTSLSLSLSLSGAVHISSTGK